MELCRESPRAWLHSAEGPGPPGGVSQPYSSTLPGGCRVGWDMGTAQGSRRGGCSECFSLAGSGRTKASYKSRPNPMKLRSLSWCD